MMARSAVELLAIENPSSRVLEIGFGPGLGLAALAERVPEGQVIGVDPSLLMHRHAGRRNAAAIAEGRIVLHRGAAAALPLSDASIDAAMMTDNLHFWPDPRAGLRELQRVLRPGAPVVCGFSPPSGGPPRGLARMFRSVGFRDIIESRDSAQYLLRAVHTPDAAGGGAGAQVD